MLNWILSNQRQITQAKRERMAPNDGVHHYKVMTKDTEPPRSPTEQPALHPPPPLAPTPADFFLLG